MKQLALSRSFLVVAVIALACLCALMLSLRAGAESKPLAKCDIAKSSFCLAPRLASSTDILHGATMPKIATPAWLNQEPPQPRTVTYSVETRGKITADLVEFKSVANRTLNDSRGWSRLGVRFVEVEKDGNFVLVLSEAAEVPSFSPAGCDSTYSCNVGKYVIINQDRWLGATPSWTGAGGNLEDYRSMVINHETGHWLGHGHSYCQEKGQPATVMQQQSMDMQGCTPNPWPLAREMYSPALGIRS